MRTQRGAEGMAFSHTSAVQPRGWEGGFLANVMELGTWHATARARTRAQRKSLGRWTSIMLPSTGMLRHEEAWSLRQNNRWLNPSSALYALESPPAPVPHGRKRERCPAPLNNGACVQTI